jgi:hypothetical protein
VFHHYWFKFMPIDRSEANYPWTECDYDRWFPKYFPSSVYIRLPSRDDWAIIFLAVCPTTRSFPLQDIMVSPEIYVQCVTITRLNNFLNSLIVNVNSHHGIVRFEHIDASYKNFRIKRTCDSSRGTIIRWWISSVEQHEKMQAVVSRELGMSSAQVRVNFV